jgi:hypothetical protein
MNLPLETPAKLVCVRAAAVCACVVCQTPGRYKIGWQIPREMRHDTEALLELHSHPLFGKTICAN